VSGTTDFEVVCSDKVGLYLRALVRCVEVAPLDAGEERDLIKGTDCDAFFIEEKWINKEVIQNVGSWLTLEDPTLYKDYDVFLSEFHTQKEAS
jgi:hypothetical protein